MFKSSFFWPLVITFTVLTGSTSLAIFLVFKHAYAVAVLTEITALLVCFWPGLKSAESMADFFLKKEMSASSPG